MDGKNKLETFTSQIVCCVIPPLLGFFFVFFVFFTVVHRPLVWASQCWGETAFIHGGKLKPSMHAALCVLFLMRCDWLECVHNCLCLRTGGLGYSSGLFVCRMGQCQLQSRGHSKKSYTQQADVMCSSSAFCCCRSDVLIWIFIQFNAAIFLSFGGVLL